MQKVRQTVCAFVVVLVLFVFSGCEKPSENQPGLPMERISFRDVPGITEDEIKAIELLRETTGSFVYAMMPNTEAFLDKNGEIRGFTALYCEWLTELFGIPFVPTHVTWLELVDGLESGTVDFTGTISSTEERRQIYFMTDAIASRTIKQMRLPGSESLSEIRKTRLPRYAVLSGSILFDRVSYYITEEFELVPVDEYIDAYELLQNGTIDALVAESPAEALFDNYGGVVA